MYTLWPVLAGLASQVTSDYRMTGFLMGVVVGAFGYWLLDTYFLPPLARLWAHHVRASRGR